MTTLANPISADRLPLARVLILMLAGAFAGLMADLRVEHVDAVRGQSVAWLPIIYAGCMAIACVLGSIFWTRTIRRIILPLFLIGFLVGGAGFYLHNRGHLSRVFRSSIHAWTDPGMDHPNAPPQTAPLAFAGLAAIGVLCSLDRFNGVEAPARRARGIA